MWAFDTRPADLDEVYWSHTLGEIQEYARLKLSWFQAQAFQQHEVMRIIIKQAFGGKPSDANTVEHKPKSKEEAVMMLGTVMRKNG